MHDAELGFREKQAVQIKRQLSLLLDNVLPCAASSALSQSSEMSCGIDLDLRSSDSLESSDVGSRVPQPELLAGQTMGAAEVCKWLSRDVLVWVQHVTDKSLADAFLEKGYRWGYLAEHFCQVHDAELGLGEEASNDNNPASQIANAW